MQEWSKGDVIHRRYELLDKLGSGGMGEVWKARDQRLRRDVAIKLLREGTPELERRFIAEAEFTSRIEHDHIVRIFDLEDRAPACIVMRYLEGENLKALLARERFLPVPRALHMIRQVIEALGAAHEVGVIHRDVKPANCIRTRHKGDDDFITVLDFGIAKLLAASAGNCLTKTGMFIGTESYASPEQLLGLPLDFRSDLYSAGVMLYELLTGEPLLFESNRGNIVFLKSNHDPKRPSVVEPRAQIPPALDELILRAVARDPDDRIQDAPAFLDAIDAIMGGTPRVLDSERARSGPTYTSVVPLDTHAVDPNREKPGQRARHGALVIATTQRAAVSVNSNDASSVAQDTTQYPDAERQQVRAETMVRFPSGTAQPRPKDLSPVSGVERATTTQVAPAPVALTSATPPDLAPAPKDAIAETHARARVAEPERGTITILHQPRSSSSWADWFLLGGLLVFVAALVFVALGTLESGDAPKRDKQRPEQRLTQVAKPNMTDRRAATLPRQPTAIQSHDDATGAVAKPKASDDKTTEPASEDTTPARSSAAHAVNDASQSEQRGLENPAHPVDKARAIAPSPVAKKTPRSKPKRVPTSTIKSKLMRLKKRCKDHRLMIPVTVTLGLKVEPSGAVSDVVAQGAGLVKGAPLYDCMLDTAKKISFKPSLEGHPDRVEASFVVPKR